MPLETVERNGRWMRRDEYVDEELSLTADRVGVLECGEEGGVNADVEVFVGLELLVPRPNARTDPSGEVITNHGI